MSDRINSISRFVTTLLAKGAIAAGSVQARETTVTEILATPMPDYSYAGYGFGLAGGIGDDKLRSAAFDGLTQRVLRAARAIPFAAQRL